MQNISGKIGMAILVALVTVSGLALAFEDQFAVLADLVGYDKSARIDTSGRVLKIAYLFVPHTLNPFSTDPATQNRLLDVYEPLVRVDENLNMQPVLAVNYGLYSEDTWEFQLRDGVTFHNGQILTTDDVIFSFNQAKARPGTVAADLMDSVESFNKSGENSIIIVTKQPDPLLLSKLTKLPILPDGFNDFERPVGTGPYEIVDSGDLTKIVYRRYEGYWGASPYFGRLEVLAKPDKNSRLDDLIGGQIDLLVDVPPDSVEDLESKGFSVKFMPSLEVGFVAFNMQDKDFSQRSLRLAIAQSLNRESFLDLAFGHANVVNQLVPSGVFGYDPDLEGVAYEPEMAADTVNRLISGFQKITVDFYFPQSLKLLGQYFSEQLQPIGLNVELKPLTDLSLQEQLSEGNLGFYYMGWRNESGDALPFLKAVLHSKGKRGYGLYNGMNYFNSTVDQLIEKSEVNFNLSERLADMQKIMRIAVEDDVIAVPLFETKSIFAFNSDLDYTPRVDSWVLPSSIRNK